LTRAKLFSVRLDQPNLQMTTQTLPRKRAASPASFENSESPAKQQKKSEKENYIKQLRNYKDSQRQSVVEKHYTMMRKNQTLEFVKRMYKEHHSMNHRKMTLKEAFTALESFVDASDPDVDTPNYSHAFQAAEGARKAGCPDWMQLVSQALLSHSQIRTHLPIVCIHD